MNIKVNTKGGGIFSKFMLAIQYINSTIDDVDKINEIYLDIDRNIPNERLTNEDQSWMSAVGENNPFDYVLDQNPNCKFDEVLRVYPRGFGTYHNINKEPELHRLKTIVSKLKIKDTVINKLKPLKGKALGVHIRLTDMEMHHPEHGTGIKTNTFYQATKNIIEKESFDSIFVSSDNDESIEYFKERMGIVYNDVGNRVKWAGDGRHQLGLQLNNSGDEDFWIDTFLEMLSLSKCSALIYRVSNLNNASVLFSQTIKYTVKL
ncbi:MAG: hypothetical protein ACJATM_001258 [Alphaproteobacteria bacterium]|jgi:hypothetical protein